jgi:hypothetical protein
MMRTEPNDSSLSSAKASKPLRICSSEIQSPSDVTRNGTVVGGPSLGRIIVLDYGVFNLWKCFVACLWGEESQQPT